MEINIKERWHDFLNAMQFAFTGETPPVAVKQEEEPTQSHTWFREVDLATGEVTDPTEEVSYWLPEDHMSKEVLKYKDPFVRFPCPNCGVEIEIDNPVLAGEVGVVQCDGCKEYIAVIAPKLHFCRLRDVPPDYQKVWEMLTTEGEQRAIEENDNREVW